jgi:anti-sigma regulatory factor (Ser/Thr protein kinase)
MSDSEIEDVKLGVDEACSNIIKYAYRGDTNQKIVIKFVETERNFTVIIEDSGVKASLKEFRGRNLNDIRPGGLGIHLIKKAFDTVILDPRKKKGNRLILTRKKRD